MTNSDIFPMYNITTGTVMLICAIDSLFVLQNPNLTQPTRNILVFKKILRSVVEAFSPNDNDNQY